MRHAGRCAIHDRGRQVLAEDAAQVAADIGDPAIRARLHQTALPDRIALQPPHGPPDPLDRVARATNDGP
jgi:hypothetical protein